MGVQVACQFSFCPIGSTEHNREVGRVVEMIESSGLYCEVGSMSTIIRGEAGEVFALLERISIVQAQAGKRYIMNLAVSNSCGCAAD